MFKSIISLALTVLASLSHAATTGASGVLSSLDGGLGGTVTVTDPTTLTITSYTLKDASAPALYWWGSTDGVIKNGFRISNEQITKAATTNTITIKLDAGKTAADFDTVGLWCERLNANFGQATLKAGSASGSGIETASGSPSATSAGASAATSMKSGAKTTSSSGSVLAAFVAAAGFAVLLG
ncbi:hypothetical protein BKA64DRAFT_208983 [Cadophora sp. MPI-SDFR-AT-0126]|nr:hypothetical protein BKA64DRAFT_208983 [Leotiomycetes sp. MPI-SDFR-AT-0126]